MAHVVTPPQTLTVAIAGASDTFPVRRIYCAGLNYADHLKEMGLGPERRPPVFFGKPSDSIVASGSDVPYPPLTEDFQFEAELVVAIGKRGFKVDRAGAQNLIWGYAVGIDLTRRDLQISCAKQGMPWEYGKAFDASAPCGPLVPAARAGDLASADIWLTVNGERKQNGRISDMLWSATELVAALSEAFVLEPGDLLYTGTPAGVGAVLPGDVLEAGVGDLPKVSIRIAAPLTAEVQ